MITAYIDFKSVDCFLAIEPIVALANDYNVAIDWLPFRTTERVLPTHVTNETVTQLHHRTRALSERRLRQHYAHIRGVKLDADDEVTDTTLALIRLTEISGNRTRFVQMAFEAQWLNHRDLSDAAVLDELCEACDATLTTAKADLDAHQKEAEAIGLFDAPTFILEGQLFLGRTHIPWMRELLETHSNA